MSGGVTPARVPVVGAVGGQGGGDRLTVHDGAVASLLGYDARRALRHDMHNIKRTIHLNPRHRKGKTEREEKNQHKKLFKKKNRTESESYRLNSVNTEIKGENN